MIQAVSSYPTAYSASRAVSFGCSRQMPVQFSAQEGNRPGHYVDEAATPQNFLQRLGERMIRWYQNNQSIDKFYAKIRLHCAYGESGSTSCSQYTLDKIRTEGFFMGCLKGLGRILNCNPISMRSETMRNWFRDDVPRGKPTSSGRRYSPSFVNAPVSARSNTRYTPSFVSSN